MTKIKYSNLLHLLANDTDEHLAKGYFVMARVRKKFLLKNKNTIIRKGSAIQPAWKYLNDGVYQVFIN